MPLHPPARVSLGCSSMYRYVQTTFSFQAVRNGCTYVMPTGGRTCVWSVLVCTVSYGTMARRFGGPSSLSHADTRVRTSSSHPTTTVRVSSTVFLFLLLLLLVVAATGTLSPLSSRHMPVKKLRTFHYCTFVHCIQAGTAYCTGTSLLASALPLIASRVFGVVEHTPSP